MNSHIEEIVGSIIAAIGTIISAIGSTPSPWLADDFQEDLNLWGNVLQATGNALEADGQGTFSLELIGNELQSIGNLTVVTGILIEFEEKTKQSLNISGNWIQALGGLVALADEFEDSTEQGQTENIIGNLLQAIGNSMQALGGAYELQASNNFYDPCDRSNDTQSLVITGSWIQAVGSVISVIGQIKEESQEIALNINE